MAKETDQLLSSGAAADDDVDGAIYDKLVFGREEMVDVASRRERVASPLSPLKFLESTSPHQSGLAGEPPTHVLDPRPRTSKTGRLFMFGTLFMISALLNFDNGAIASSLIPITQEFGLSFSQQGFLGSLVYLGLTISSLVAGE